MNSAGHQIMMAPIQKDISWDYDTVFDIRSKFAQELAPVCRMPSLVASYTSTLLQSYTLVVLSIKRGLIGFLGRYNATDQILHYWLFDSENNVWEDTGLTIDIGTTSFSAGIAINRAGKIVFVSRYLGKVWTFDQDGSNLEYVGQTSTNFSTNFGIRLYANYDGTCTVFGMDTNNGPIYCIDENYNITQTGTITSTYPYTYKKLPGKVVITGSTGLVSVYDENMSTSYVLNRSVSSYASLAQGLLMSPFAKDLVMYGMCTKTNKIGVNASTYVDFTTAASNRYVESNNVGAYLPTGEYVWRHGYHASYSTQPICDRIYNQNADTITDIRTMSGTENIGGNWRALPTGKYFDRYYYNGTTYFDLYDFGFDKKYFYPALCISPFGYNP